MMKRITLRMAIALLTFLIGISLATYWLMGRRADIRNPKPSVDCIPAYDTTIYAKHELSRDEAILERFEEIPLQRLPSCVDESYRLVWVPTFHSPVVVRVWRSGEKYYMVVKQLEGRGGYGVGNLNIDRTSSLTESEWMDFVHRIYPASFWELPSTIDEPLPNDGATWVVEGVSDKKYHSVRRVNPQGQFADLIKYFIKMSGLKTEHDKYLP